MRVFTAATALAIMFTACSDQASTSATGSAGAASGDAVVVADDPSPPNAGRTATVDFVQDGDSAIVIIDGEEERVRLIGINTPERDECFGTESRELLKGLIEGNTVQVVTDVEPTDRFGRVLAYLYLDELLVNAELVRAGAAIARPFEPNTTLQDTLEAAEAIAKAEGVGMWAPSTCGGDETPSIAVVAVNENAPGRDDENPNGEWVVVENVSDTAVDLTGWGVKDESSTHRYTFPDGTIVEPGDQLTVYSGCGSDDPPDLYWCDGTPVWDNSGDTAFLTDASGAVRHRFSYEG